MRVTTIRQLIAGNVSLSALFWAARQLDNVARWHVCFDFNVTVILQLIAMGESPRKRPPAGGGVDEPFKERERLLHREAPGMVLNWAWLPSPLLRAFCPAVTNDH